MDEEDVRLNEKKFCGTGGMHVLLVACLMLICFSYDE
jgi:hypothetical protein